MNERVTLEAEPRVVADERAQNLRKAGIIPAVIYGQGDNTLLKIENLALRRVLKEAGTTHLIDITVEDITHTVVVKDVQSHVTRGDLIHVDFYEVDMEAKIIVEADLVTTGIAAPVASGLGTTALVLYSVEIECMPDALISTIEIDLGQIKNPDDMIYVRDLPISSGVEVLTDPDAVVVRFEYTPIEEEEEEDIEEELMFAPSADEVEVITKGKIEDEDFDD
ncbi:MAG TPA: 50S ribosomal protein L25 [candidate division Zixibacteria bacterium]|nr:50S ribosomal protein L25 [candidate division Zixibacteria bacterium]